MKSLERTARKVRKGHYVASPHNNHNNGSSPPYVSSNRAYFSDGDESRAPSERTLSEYTMSHERTAFMQTGHVHFLVHHLRDLHHVLLPQWATIMEVKMAIFTSQVQPTRHLQKSAAIRCLIEPTICISRAVSTQWRVVGKREEVTLQDAWAQK